MEDILQLDKNKNYQKNIFYNLQKNVNKIKNGKNSLVKNIFNQNLKNKFVKKINMTVLF